MWLWIVEEDWPDRYGGRRWESDVMSEFKDGRS